MKTVEIQLGEETFKLATTLRVAYVLQNMNNHKPYLDIFQDLDKMTLEKQIEFLYAAYTIGEPEGSLSKEQFLNLCLDYLDVNEVMQHISKIIEGVTGKKLDDLKKEQGQDKTEDEKN